MPEGEGDGRVREGARDAELSAVIDRFEGDTAVLSLGDGRRTLDVPRSRLPEGASDGDHLRLTFRGEPSADTLAEATKDDDSRDAAEARIKALRERLEARGGQPGKKNFKL